MTTARQITLKPISHLTLMSVDAVTLEGCHRTHARSASSDRRNKMLSAAVAATANCPLSLFIFPFPCDIYTRLMPAAYA